jgi:hypothetical protein
VASRSPAPDDGYRKLLVLRRARPYDEPVATTESVPLTLRRLEDHLWQAADLFRNKVSNLGGSIAGESQERASRVKAMASCRDSPDR